MQLEEFLNLVESSNEKDSSIVQELIRRINVDHIAKTPLERMVANTRTNHECPECGQMLDISIQEGGSLLYLGLKKT